MHTSPQPERERSASDTDGWRRASWRRSDVEEDRITVLFEDVGYRTLSLELVEEQQLLVPAG